MCHQPPFLFLRTFCLLLREAVVIYACFPPIMGRCTRLFELKAGHNKLSGLPATFKLCYRLRVLDLAGNQIKSTSGIQVNTRLRSVSYVNRKRVTVREN